MMESLVVTDIHAPDLYDGIRLPMWVLYGKPVDMPEHFVLRLWDAMDNTPTKFVFLAETMEGIEAQIDAVPGRFYRLSRYEADDAKILATYL